MNESERNKQRDRPTQTDRGVYTWSCNEQSCGSSGVEVVMLLSASMCFLRAYIQDAGPSLASMRLAEVKDAERNCVEEGERRRGERKGVR